MTQKLAPAYEVAREKLNNYFNTTHQIMTTRQLKAACGGSGSNETYLEYISRWRAERIESTGVLSSLLSLQNSIESFAKSIHLQLSTISDQLRMCPIEIHPADVESACAVEDAVDRKPDPIESDSPTPSAQDAKWTAYEERDARVAKLRAGAAEASEARFLDEDPEATSDDAYRSDAPERATPSDDASTREPDDTSLSRDDTGSRQTALPLGTNQSGPDERETIHDRRAD
ncbi:hypothetical protein AAG594_09030 [Citromicrobium bathyomarinum]